MSIEPVFLPASKRLWKPGYICSHEPLTVCAGFSVENNKVTYQTLTYKKGCPQPLTLDEACLREYLGSENLKKLYMHAHTLEQQRHVLSTIHVIGWCRWDFTGDEPIPIIGETSEEYRVLFHPCCNSAVNGNVSAVYKEDVQLVSVYDAWKYWWSGHEINCAIQKESLPESIREDLVCGMY